MAEDRTRLTDAAHQSKRVPHGALFVYGSFSCACWKSGILNRITIIQQHMQEHTISISQKVLWWCATLTMVLLPVFFIPVEWATIAHAKFALLAVGVVVGVLALSFSRLRMGSISVPRSWVFAGALLIPIAYLLSAFMTTGVTESVFGYGVERDTLLAAVLWFGALVLGFFGFENRDQIVRAYKALLIVTSLMVVFQVVRLLIGVDILTLGGVLRGTAASLVGSWHDFGIFLGFVVALGSVFLGSTHAQGVVRWVVLPAILVGYLGLVLVNAIDVWVALIVFALAVLSYRLWSYRTVQIHTWKNAVLQLLKSALVPLLVVSALFAFFGDTIHSRLPEPLRVAQVEVRPSWEGTFSVASAVYRSSGALFGSGPNTFVRQWGMFKPAGVNETAFWNADFSQSIGFIPTTFITLGVVGIAAWFLFFIAMLLSTARVLRRAVGDTTTEPVAIGLFGGSLFLWGLLFVYPPGPAVITFAFFTTGLALSWAAHSGLLNSKVIDVRGLGVFGKALWYLTYALFVAVMVGAAVLLLRSVVSDMYVNRAVVLFNANQDVAGAQASLSQALRVQPKNDRAYRASVELGIAQLGLLAQDENPDTEALRTQLQETIAAAIQNGLTAVSMNPGDYENWLTLARAYEQLVGARVEGASERAEEAYRNAIATNPTSPAPHLLLARLALAEENVDLAITELTEAINKKPNYAEAHYLMSQIHASRGEVPEATDAAVLAVQSAPQEPVAWFQLGVLLYGQGDYQRASEALSQAVLLNNNYANALYVLALSFVELGKFDEATRVLEQVLILNPENENVMQLIEALKSRPAPTAETNATGTATTTQE